MNILQRNFCSTGKTKLKRSQIADMEYYSCSKMMQSDSEMKERGKTQPMRIKELLKSSDVSRSAKKVSTREKCKPERLTLALTGTKVVESALTGEGSKLGTKGIHSESKVRARNVRRKLCLNFGTPKNVVDNNRSIYAAKKTGTKEVQDLSTIYSKTENFQTNKTAPNKSRNSFLVPPNTIRNMLLRKQTQRKDEILDTTHTDKPLSLSCEKRYSTIDEEQTNSTNIKNSTDRLVPDRETIIKESEKAELSNRNKENATMRVNVASRENSEITRSEHRTSQVQTLPVTAYSVWNANASIAHTHCTQKSYLQLPDLNLSLYTSSLPIISQRTNDHLYNGEVQDAMIQTTALKHTSHEQCQRICTGKSDIATVKSNLRNIIRTTEESLTQLKSVLACMEEMSLEQKDKAAEMIVASIRDDRVNSSDMSTAVSSEERECTTALTVPEALNVKVDKEVTAEMQNNRNEADDEDEKFEIIDHKDLVELASENSAEVPSEESPVAIEVDSNKENCENVESVQQLDSKKKLKKLVNNLASPSQNDSFLTLENELNILHMRPSVQTDSSSEGKSNVANEEVRCTGKFAKSIKEYMLLKSELNCLETPNEKKFRSVYTRDTKSVPSSMHKTYMSGLVLAELQNLHTESPDL